MKGSSVFDVATPFDSCTKATHDQADKKRPNSGELIC